jgi:hypothetical protein
MMMTLTPLLALDAGDLIKIVVLILFFVIPVVGRLMSAVRKAAPRQDDEDEEFPDPDDSEAIDEFLRRHTSGGDEVQMRPVMAEPVIAEVVSQPSRLGLNRSFDRFDSHLAEEVEMADEALVEHLHDVFDHQVGRLVSTSVHEEADAPESPAETVYGAIKRSPNAAAGLASLLADKQNIRQAIVVNEILARPEQRWNR